MGRLQQINKLRSQKAHHFAFKMVREKKKTVAE